MLRSAQLLPSLALVLLACGGGQKPAAEQQPIPQPLRPLANLAAQRVIVTPAFSVATGDVLGWAAKIPRSRDYLKSLDDAIAAALAERGLKTQWVYPPDLVRAQKANPTYAVDPYAMGVNVLRNPAVVSGAQLGDPLATQLRTMIALQEGTRAVLVPVQVHFERIPTGEGVAVLRLALLDGRLADVRWIGSVRSDPVPDLSPAVLTNLAAHFADLIAAP